MVYLTGFQARLNPVLHLKQANGIQIQAPPRQRSVSIDSEQLSVSATSPPERERRFSLSQMLGGRTSIQDAYNRYAAFTTNGGASPKHRGDIHKPPLISD
uniref:Uncharacterized protein n=1 Tax=Ascaris lumbricoides TaxID=6252 RepID=A0A9J2P896_ASCLU